MGPVFIMETHDPTEGVLLCITSSQPAQVPQTRPPPTGTMEHNSIRDASRRIAVCGAAAALCVVLMALGSALGVMTYVCPMLAGLVVGAVREEFGVRDALTLWAATGLLGLLLIPELEMAALFAGLFGWYAAVRPTLERLPRWRRRLVKSALFLVSVLAIYGALFLLLGLEGLALERSWEAALLLALFCPVFFLYDRALRLTVPRLGLWLRRLLPRR